MDFFTIQQLSKLSSARRGKIQTDHGSIETPFFMPIATKGAIRALDKTHFQNLESKILLSNTYHLYLRPGEEFLRKVGGLHSFMDWQGIILTDSGGFQAFSLGNRGHDDQMKAKILPHGIEFRSIYDGSKHLFTPENVIDMQRAIGSDIMMILDECVSNPSTYEKALSALIRTTQWAKQALHHHQSHSGYYGWKQRIFCIVQGSTFSDLRQRSARELSQMNFDGYAVGGLAVGESNEEMYSMLDILKDELPQNKPHYLMGVGKPENIVEAVKRGIDMFDCVIPSREARHGRLYIWEEKENFQILFDSIGYSTINITNASIAEDFSPLVANSDQEILKTTSKAYLYHLFRVGDPLALSLASLVNIEFYLELMKKIRLAIEKGDL